MKSTLKVIVTALILLSSQVFAVCVERTITADRVVLDNVWTSPSLGYFELVSKDFNKTASAIGCALTEGVAVRRARKKAAEDAAEKSRDAAVSNFTSFIYGLCAKYDLNSITIREDGTRIFARAYTGLSSPKFKDAIYYGFDQEAILFCPTSGDT